MARQRENCRLGILYKKLRTRNFKFLYKPIRMIGKLCLPQAVIAQILLAVYKRNAAPGMLAKLLDHDRVEARNPGIGLFYMNDGSIRI